MVYKTWGLTTDIQDIKLLLMEQLIVRLELFMDAIHTSNETLDNIFYVLKYFDFNYKSLLPPMC